MRRHEKLFASAGVFYYVAKHGNQIVGFSSGGPNRDLSLAEPHELYGLYLLQPLELGGRLWPVERYTWRQALAR